MASLFKLVGSVFVDTDSAQDSLQKVDNKAESTGNSLSNLGGKMEKLGGKMESLGKFVAPVSAGVAALGTALFGSAVATASAGDNVDKLSQKMGLSRTEFQELDFVMSQCGTDINSFQGGMKTLTANMDKVTEGNKTAISNFEKLGVSVTDASGKMRSQEDVLNDTIRAFQEMEDGTEKSRLATELFGKSGQELLPLLNSEAGSFDELRKRAQELGIVLDDDAIDASVKFTDTMDEFKRTLGTLGQTIGVAVMPYITAFLSKCTEYLPKVKDFLKGVIEKFDALSTPVKTAIGVIGGLLAGLSPALIIGGKIITWFGKIMTFLGTISNPIMIVIGVVGAFVAMLVYFYNTNEEIRKKVNTLWNKIKGVFILAFLGIKSAIKVFIDTATSLWDKYGESIIETIQSVFELVIDAVSGFIDIVMGFWNEHGDEIISTLMNVWNTVYETVSVAIEFVIKLIQTFVETARTFWEEHGDEVVGVFNFIFETAQNIWGVICDVIDVACEFIQGVISAFTSVLKGDWEGAWTIIKDTCSNLIDGTKKLIEDAFNGIKEFLSPIIDWLKGIFDFEWHLPDIKTPHFFVSGGEPPWGFLGMGSLPNVTVKWYRKAYDHVVALDNPSIFGEAGGKLLGGGDGPGREIVSGEDHLVELMNISVGESLGSKLDAIASIVEQYIPEIASKDFTIDGEKIAKNSNDYIKKWDLRGASAW